MKTLSNKDLTFLLKKLSCKVEECCDKESNGGETEVIPYEERNYFSGNHLITSVGEDNSVVTLNAGMYTITTEQKNYLKTVMLNVSSSDFPSGYVDVKIVDKNLNLIAEVPILKAPVTELIKRDNFGTTPPTDIFPFIYTKDTGTVSQVQIIDYGIDYVTLRFKNIDNYGEFTIVIKP